MRHPCVRPSTQLSRCVLASSVLAIGLACGSSDDEQSEPPPSSGAAGTSSSPSAPSTNGPAPANTPTPEEIAALTEMIGMAADQIQSACGTTFDSCGATPGCNEILTCAARNACSGADCYCLGADCSMPGPCRTVIETAPGARAPDASNPSLGPASDAARAVGQCLQGLGGGGSALPPLPTPSQLPAPAGDAGTGAADAA
jgi:hypothetical protein